MVFSFFKKNTDKKMPEREIVRPKPAAAPPQKQSVPPQASDERSAPVDLPDLEFTPAGAKSESAPSKEVSAKQAIELFEEEFTQSAVMAIDVDHGADSIQSDVEQVAVLYANGQDAAVRPLLESLLNAYPGTEGLRLWLMLFDFLLLNGDRAGFDKLSADFMQACEMSPPAWRQTFAATPAKNDSGVAVCTLQGVLTSEDASVLEVVADAIKSKKPLRLDCSGLAGCDDEMAGRLAELLMGARRQGAVIVVEHTEGLVAKLRGRLKMGEASNARSWLLLLELLQRSATQEDFEQVAIDFAVTFERSPPSWEAVPVPKLPVGVKAVEQQDSAHYLSGDIKNNRFDDLAAILSKEENIVVDFSGVRRMDFFSAGQLVNRVSSLRSPGREIVFRCPNHLVAELMAVVGLNKYARIVVPKA